MVGMKRPLKWIAVRLVGIEAALPICFLATHRDLSVCNRDDDDGDDDRCVAVWLCGCVCVCVCESGCGYVAVVVHEKRLHFNSHINRSKHRNYSVIMCPSDCIVYPTGSTGLCACARVCGVIISAIFSFKFFSNFFAKRKQLIFNCDCGTFRLILARNWLSTRFLIIFCAMHASKA